MIAKYKKEFKVTIMTISFGGDTLTPYKKYTEYYVFIIMCAIPLFFLPTSEIDPFRLPKVVLWAISLMGTIILMLAEKAKSKRRVIRIFDSKIYWLIALHALIWTISTIFSVDWLTSLTGIPFVNGWVQMVMSIVTFALISSQYKFEERHLTYILIVYSIIGLYCVLQFYNLDPFVNYYGDEVLKFTGQTFATIGNQNYVSTCLSVVYVIIAFFFILGDHKYLIRIVYFVGILLIFSGVIATKTRGGWVAIAFTFAVALPLVMTKKEFVKRYLAVIISNVTVLLIIDMTSGGSIIFKRIMPMFFQAREISKGNISADFGSRRLEIWINSMELVKKYWLIGSGPDTFTTVYSNFGFYPKDSFGNEQIIFLSAHNESLQLIITTGIFSMITYWLIVGRIMKTGFERIKTDRMIVPLLLGLVCYLIKGMFNCSVVTDMIIFWVLLAVTHSYASEEYNDSNSMVP